MSIIFILKNLLILETMIIELRYLTEMLSELMLEKKTHTFKTNISSGGIMRPCSVSNEQISLAQKAVESLKITTSIVDIVTDRNKRNYILEVNPIMGIFVEAGMKYSDKSIIKNPDLSYSNDELKLNVLVNYIKQIIE